MTEREKKLWGWAGKILLVAIPAAISGYTSYKQSQLETEAQGAASYTVMRAAVEELRKDLNDAHAHIYALEGQVALLKEFLQQARMMTPGVRPVLPVRPDSRPDAGVDGDGIPDSRPLKHPATKSNLPTNYNDMVQQYRPKK